MRKRIVTIFVCFLAILLICSGCSTKDSKKNIKLTEAQEAGIEVLVKYRNEWKETSEYATAYPVNRVNVTELSDGTIFLTVAYVSEGTGSMQGVDIFVGVKGYIVKDGKVVAINKYNKYWQVECMEAENLSGMSDAELQQLLRESLIYSLERKQSK